MIARHQAAVRRMLALLGVSSGQVVFLVVLGMVTVAFEVIGIGLLVPLLGYVESGPVLFEESRLAGAVAQIVAPLGIGPSLPLLFVAAFVPVLGRQLFKYLREIYAARIRFAAVARLRREGAAALLNADLAFVLGRGEARLVGTLTTEVERCVSALQMFLQLIESALLIAVYLIMLFVVAAPLVPVVVSAMWLAAVTIRTNIRNTERWGRDVTVQVRAFHEAVSERLLGFRLVKLRAREAEESEHIGRLADTLALSHMRISRVKEAFGVSVEPIMLAGVFLALYIAVDVLGVGLASLGVFGVIVLRLIPLLQQGNIARLGIASLIGGLQETADQAESARASAFAEARGVRFPGVRRELVFDGVGFRYGEHDDVWALRDVSFRVPKGSLTAIVGRSGAGKSTLLDLVPRLRPVTRGAILVDGLPMEHFDVASLRRSIGFVDQQGFLFEGTIAENIAYGAPQTRPEAIADAARRAHAAEFIERFPDGYSTRVGSRGNHLSVGQRQRVCIARMLLQDPDILLLDEPTSALDGESEQYIRAMLGDIRARKAVIVVAHRLSTIRDADQVIVLDEGRVVERGSPDGLLARPGIYQQLFDLQVHG